jgi:hypothetical protein
VRGDGALLGNDEVRRAGRRHRASFPPPAAEPGLPPGRVLQLFALRDPQPFDLIRHSGKMSDRTDLHKVP